MQPWSQGSGLDTDLAFAGHNPALGHVAAKPAAFQNGDFHAAYEHNGFSDDNVEAKKTDHPQGERKIDAYQFSGHGLSPFWRRQCAWRFLIVSQVR